MKYTKGKWEIKNSGLISKPFEITGCDVVVEKESNAKLISKAPEMYEALEGISRIKDLLCYPLDVPFEHIDEAKAVSVALGKVESLLNEIDNG